MESKICKSCISEYPLSLFNKRTRSIDGYNSLCKKCYKLQRKKKKTDLPTSDITEKLCTTCNTIKSITKFKTTAKSTDNYFYKCNDCWKPIEWNKEKRKQSEKKYVESHREKMKEKWRKQGQKINRRIRDSLNHRISEMLKSQRTHKCNTTLKYIGCDVKFLKKWFEYLFETNMAWDNYGEWHIDHVIPCKYYNFEQDKDQLQCFNWTNLRPCWKIENIQKGSKMIDSIINQQKINVEQFLNINPLPTLSGNSVEGTE